jgi:cytochrome c oxidase subunit 3
MAAEVLEAPTPTLADSGGDAPPRVPGGGGDAPGGPAFLSDAPRFGLWLFLGTVTMLFIGFTSAYILRRAALDWRPLAAPPVLWLSTSALFLSSMALELARRRHAAFDLAGALRWFGATGLLGVLFVAGQVAAWRALSAAGVFLSSHPHSSFFYLLTGVHVVHVTAGLVWYAAALGALRRRAAAPGSDPLRLFATYWHFLAVLWGYLLFLLFVY